MKERLVIIGANDFQNQLILKAKDMGYETHVFAWQCGDVGEKTADHFYPISIVEKEQILEVCLQIQPVGIVSIASDLASITVNYVAEQLGLVGNGSKSAEISTNKHLMRQVFEANGLPSPKSALVEPGKLDSLPDFQYPVIVKPTDRSGSRGIFKVESPQQLSGAIARAQEQSFEGKVLVEEYAQGNEYSIEYISWQGEHTFLAMTKKYTTEAPYFIETGHIQPAYDVSPEVLAKIKALVPRILDALGVRYGASHTEVKIDRNGEIKIIETGARMGGDCIGSDLVYLSTGYDFVKMVIDVACGKAPELKREHSEACAGIRFIFSKDDLDQLDWVQREHGGLLRRISQIDTIDDRTIGDSSSRYGYYLMSSERAQDIIEIMEKVNG